jgi:hypothetical protein
MCFINVLFKGVPYNKFYKDNLHRIITTGQLSLGSTNENILKNKQRKEPRVNMDKSKKGKQK